MKGRVPPPGRAFWDVDGTDQDHRLQLQLSGRTTTTFPKQPCPRKPPDWDSLIVQFPKDQIYHIPPQERTEFVQRLREKHSGAVKPYQTRACKITAAVIVLLIALTILLTTLSPLFSPKGPSFSVSRLTVRSHRSPKQSSSYRVTVRARNPNEKTSMLYNSLGLAYLTFKGETIGSGKGPDLEQDSGRSSNVQLVLDGSEEEELPKKVEKSLKNSRPKDLVLKMSFSVRLKLGFIKTKASDTDVTCKLRVKSLRGATKILRQHCHT